MKCVLSWLLGGESCLLVMCMVQVKLVMDLNKFKLNLGTGTRKDTDSERVPNSLFLPLAH